MWVQAKKCGLSNQHGLKNEIPCLTMGLHIGECRKLMALLMAQSQQVPDKGV